MSSSLVLLLTAMAAMQPAAVPPDPRPLPKRPAILMISLDDPDQPIVRRIYEVFLAELSRSVEHPIVYREFYDQVRFGDRQSYADDYLSWLHHKYKGVRIDLIVATQQQTLQLVADGPGNPWSGLPVVYATVGQLTIDIAKSHPTASGVVMENYTLLTLGAIKTIFPGTRRVPADREFRRRGGSGARHPDL
jgi:hypothetical protein